MANPLACAVSRSSVDLLLSTPWETMVKDIEQQLLAELAVYRHYEVVTDVRVIGAIGVVETRNPVPIERVQNAIVDAGVWIRPFRNLIYVMPPFVIESNDLSGVTNAIGQGLKSM
ncbi:MAG: aminotransferase class III-fold pyridoxal phosphate-dependent enzyme [Planctomycetota bacterium]